MAQIQLEKELTTPATPDSGFISLWTEGTNVKYIDDVGTIRTLAEGVTLEQVQDLLATSFSDTSTITWTYDDPSNVFTADISASTLNLINGSAQFSTGIQAGAQLSVGGATGTFSVSAGSGVVVDAVTDVLNPDRTQVTIAAKTDVTVTNIAGFNVTYVTIDKFDAVQQYTTLPSAQLRRQEMYIGVVVHSDHVNVNVVNPLPVVALDVPAQLIDFLEAVGFMKASGNDITPFDGDLRIVKSAGDVFRSGVNFYNNNLNPNTITLPIQSPVTFRYRNQNGDEDSNETFLVPSEYDNAGTTTTVPLATDATIQRVYMFPSGAIRIQRGQEVFSSFALAIDAVGDEDFVIEPNIGENGLLLCVIVMRKDATDVSDRSEALVFHADRFGEITSVGSVAATDYRRSEHTGTQLASTISDFQATVSLNTDVASNTANNHTHGNQAALDLVSGTNTGDEVTATETVEGVLEIATQAETDALTVDNKIVTPLKLVGALKQSNLTQEINAQTGTTYTVVDADHGKLITLDNAAAIALSVNTGLRSDFQCAIYQKGVGQVTIGGTATINEFDGLFDTAGQYAFASIIHMGSDVYGIQGRLT